MDDKTQGSDDGDRTLAGAGGAPDLTQPSAGRPDDAERTLPGSAPAAAAPVDATIANAARTLPGPAPQAAPQAAGAAKGPKVTVGAPRSALADGQVIGARFVVQKELGAGGMGAVYAVKDTKIEGRSVALKVLLPKYSRNTQFRNLFFQEVRAAQNFVSEHICQVRDTGETEDGRLYFTMDMIEGESLRALLDREKLLGPRHALEIARQMLLGLQSGHEKGYVHRDVKPSNVMLAARVAKTDTNPHGVGVRLLDFGIAGIASEIDVGSRAGTVMYMSPEQAAGERLDPRSDLFAVGVVLFEMLSGRRPFEGNTTQTMVDSVMSTNLSERLDDVPNLSKPLRALLEKALQKDRNRRFQSAGEFAQAIVKSSAYRVPVQVPAWAWAVVAGAVGIAGFAGYKASAAAGEVKGLEKELAAVDARLVEAATKAREEASSARQREVDEWKAKHASELSARQAAETAAAAALAEKNSADKTLKEKQNEVENLAGQLSAERQAKNLVETAKQTQEQRIQELEKTVAQLKEANTEIERTSKPEARLARSFDELAKVVESGFGESAQRLLASDENVKALAADVLLADFLNSLVQATALVETHQRSVGAGGKPHLGALLEAETALVKATERLVAMEANPGAWAQFQFVGQAARERLAEGRRLVAELSTKIDAQQAASLRDVQASWTALQAKSPISDSAAYFEHLEHYGSPEQLTESVQRLRAELVAQAQDGDTLKPAVLAKATALPEWVRRIDAAGLATSSVTSDVRLFEFARRWYDDDFANDAFDWTKVQLERATAPTSDWRQVLRLQHTLAQANSAYPTKKSGRVVLREVDNSGRVSWIESLDATPEGDGAAKGSWRIKLQTFSAEGRKDQSGHELRMRRVDYSVQSDDGVQIYLDLRSRAATQRVEPLPTLANVDVPAAVLAAQELRTFRSAWEEAPLGLCLLVTTDNGQRKRWFSPEFGLVREELAGTLTRDLVYSR